MPIIASAVASPTTNRVKYLQATLGGNLNMTYVDQYGGLHVVEIVGGSPSGGIPSSPPSGKYKVVNLWVDPATGKLTVEYDTTPVP